MTNINFVNINNNDININIIISVLLFVAILTILLNYTMDKPFPSQYKKCSKNKKCNNKEEITLSLDLNNSNNLYIMFDYLYLGYDSSKDNLILVDGTIKNIEFNTKCIFNIVNSSYIYYGDKHLSTQNNRLVLKNEIDYMGNSDKNKVQIVKYNEIPCLKINGKYVSKTLNIVDKPDGSIFDIIDRETETTIISEIKNIQMESYVNLREYPLSIRKDIYNKEPFEDATPNEETNLQYNNLCVNYAKVEGSDGSKEDKDTNKFKFCVSNNKTCDETSKYNYVMNKSNATEYSKDLQNFNIQVKMENLNRTNDLIAKENELTSAVEMMKDTFNNLLIRDIAKEFYFNKDTKYYML